MSTQLRDALLATFGDKPFDTTSVGLAAAHNPHLAAAIEASLPPHRRGQRRKNTVARVLKAMARQYFDTDPCGYWTIKPPVSDPWPDMQVPLPSPARSKEPA
jgi:hypothetical protein